MPWVGTEFFLYCFFAFILIDVFWASCTSALISHINIRKFSIIASNNSFTLFPLSSPLSILITCMFQLMSLSQSAGIFYSTIFSLISLYFFGFGFYWHILKFIDFFSLAVSSLLIGPSKVFFISVTVFFFSL